METLELDLEKDQQLDKLSSYIKKKKFVIGKDKIELTIRSEAEISQTVHAAFVIFLWNYFYAIQSQMKAETAFEQLFEKTLSEYFFTYNVEKLELNMERYLGVMIHWESKTTTPDAFGIWKNDKRSLNDIREKAWQRKK